MTDAAKPTPGYIPVLDGLRAVSIALVLLGHILLRDRPTPWLLDFGLVISSYGVTVFFVISGYLITLLMLREEDRNGSISLKKFYIRRVLRIFPALYVYILAIGLLSALGYINDVPWHDYVASVGYIRNVFGRAHETGPLWSLSLEEQFYMIWPAAVIVLGARRRLPALAVAMVAFTAWRMFLIATGRTNPAKLYMRPDQRLDTILVGCGLALLRGRPRFERLTEAVLRRGWFAAAIGLMIAAWLSFGYLIPHQGAIEHTTTAVLIALAVHWTIRNAGTPAVSILQIPAVLFVGRLSYSLYLWHGLFMVERAPGMDAVRRFPIDLALTVVCAVGSYYLVERPFLALKDRRFR